jgi:filamentous hemagglutinin family protein
MVSRTSVNHSLSVLSLGVAVAWTCTSLAVHANPVGGVAIAGQASMVTTGNQLLVTTQNSAGTSHSAINWQSFSVPAGSSTYFQQPSAASTVINRVVTNTPSQIFGTLGSNGHLVLVNQAGIAVGAGAVVDTAGFTASALRMSDADALSGRLRFGDSSAAGTGVSVQGSILARSGDVVLIGSSVDTGSNALIQAPNGSTILAAGQRIEITGRGLEGISLQVQAPNDSVVNLGVLKGDAVGIFAGTLRHSGAIRATAASLVGGKVVLKAAELLVVDGEVRARAADEKGGVVHATARSVVLKDSALIDVSSANGGGEVLIGGGWHGEDARISNAQQTIVAAGAQINADAMTNGSGGEIVVWADGLTRFSGSVSARGGAGGGDGGRAEVSGKQALDFLGAVDLTAAQGRFGSLLLDPATITIGATPAVDGSTGDVSGNILSTDYSGASSQITATQVAAILNSTNLSLAATGNIDVNAAIAKASGGASTLTLNSSSGNITIAAPISSASGALSVALTATSGNISATGAGAIATNGGAVTMSAGGNVALSTAISSLGGNVAISAGGYIEAKAVTTTPGGGNGGNISFISTGSYTKLGVGGGNIDARFAGTGISGTVTIASGGTVNMESGNTIYANDLGITAVGGISNSGGGAVALQAARLRSVNTGGGSVKLQHTGPNGIAIHDLGAGTTAGLQTTGGSSIEMTSTLGLLTVDSSVTTVNGDVFLYADKMDILKSINSGSNSTGTVTLVPYNNPTVIKVGNVGDTTNSTLELSDAELSKVTSGSLRVGASGYTGGIDVATAIAPAASVGSLYLINGGAITQSGTGQITVAKLGVDSTAGVTLNLANNVTTLIGRAGSAGFSFTNNSALAIGTVGANSGIVTTGAGSISLTATSGAGSIDVQQPITTTGIATISVVNTLSGSGVISAGTLNLTNGSGGASLTGSNQIANLSLGGGGGLISIKNDKSAYALNVGTVNGVTITGGGTVNVGSWTSSGATSISSNGGISASNFNTSGTLSLYSLGTVNVASSAGLTVTNASGALVSLSSSSAGVSINGSVTSAGNITLAGYGGLTLTGATVASSGGTVSASSTMGGVNVNSGSVVSGKTMNFSTPSDVQVTSSTLRPGGVGGTGVLNVTSGNLKMNGGSKIELDVISATSFDKVDIASGALAVLSSSEGITVTDQSFGAVSGSLALLSANGGIGGAGLPLLFTGPTGWTLTQGANALTVNAVPTASVGTANLVSTFLDNFEAALQAQQETTDAKEKAKDALVVEAEICPR